MSFSKVAFPIVRRVFGGLIANELVSVQPLPKGLSYTYGEPPSLESVCNDIIIENKPKRLETVCEEIRLDHVPDSFWFGSEGDSLTISSWGHDFETEEAEEVKEEDFIYG